MQNIQPIMGEDPAFLAMLEHVSRLAPIERPCLVMGERGSGKELIGARLHYLSRRWGGPLVKINCAALSESLLDSELFGHEAGSFTGASRRHIGRFERAHRGTIILDEIATASTAIQEKLLRVVEYGEIERIGGSETITVDTRIIGITNENLPEMAKTGAFRPDLLDRLAFDVIAVPPLRKRPNDILLLAEQFAIDITKKLGRAVFSGFSEKAQTQLLSHDWPGNVRELRNAVERSLYLHESPSDPLDYIRLNPFSDLQSENPAITSEATCAPAPATPNDPPINFHQTIAQFERDILKNALARNGQNQTKAAQDLDLSYHQLRRLIEKHDLKSKN